MAENEEFTTQIKYFVSFGAGGRQAMVGETLRVKLRARGTHILWFHTDVFTELLHGLWIDHFVGAGVLLEPSQALLIGEELLSTTNGITDLRAGETTTHTKRFKMT